MGLFRSCGLKSEQLAEPERCVLSGVEAYAQAEAQEEEDEGKVQVNQQPPPPARVSSRDLASASPWNTEESMGRLLSSKTSSNILPEAEHSKGRSLQELYSVLQRDLIHTAVISYIIIVLLSVAA